jgi:arginase
VATLLLYPEWQGSGKSPSLQPSAVTLAHALFPRADFLAVESPADEHLLCDSNVVGLHSIAPRFRDALARLRDAAPDRIVTIGGTCGVEAAPIAYLNERYSGDLAVVWFDAHGDLNTPESSPSGNFHGMIVRTLLGEGPDAFVRELRPPLQPRQVFLVGTRDLDPPEQAFIEHAGISVTPPLACGRPQELVERIKARGFTHVYLHLDLDVLDPADFVDMLIPTPGGPPIREVGSMLAALHDSFEPVGASIVEYVHGSDESLRKVAELSSCFCRI